MFEEVNKKRERERERERERKDFFFLVMLCPFHVFIIHFCFCISVEKKNTLNRCKTRTAFLYWRRWWEQPRHHKERKAHKLSSKARSFVLQRSLACWSCSQSSSTPLFPFPSLSLSLYSSPSHAQSNNIHSQNLEYIYIYNLYNIYVGLVYNIYCNMYVFYMV